MDSRFLESLVAVVEEGSIAAAAPQDPMCDSIDHPTQSHDPRADPLVP